MKKQKLSCVGGGKRAERNSGLELLRIITMLCIVAHHYIVNSGIMEEITFSNTLRSNSLFALIFGWGGKTGIDCFMLITGYFMCKSKINAQKFLRVFWVIEFYKIAFYLIFILTGYEIFLLKALIKTVFPIYDIGSGFASTYLIFFLFIPYLNLLLECMDENQHLYLIILCLLVGTILQTFFKASPAFSYVGWFMVLYLIASYIRFFSDGDYENKWIPKNIFNKKKIWGITALISLLLSWCSVIIGAILYHFTNKNAIYYFVSDYNKLLAVSTSICVFLFFKNLNIGSNRIINTVAKSTFGVLMIHANSDTMRKWLWKDLFNNVYAYKTGTNNFAFFIMHAFGTIIAVYCICTIIDMVRIQTCSYIKSMIILERKF